MGCGCEHHEQVEKKKGFNTPPVIQIDGGETPVLFHTVVIPASQGDKDTIPPMYGDYRNTRVYYEANKMSFLYDSDGIPQLLSGVGGVESVNGQVGEVIITAQSIGAATTQALADEATARDNADIALGIRIDGKADSSTVQSLAGDVADNTAAIALKANSADVYTKTEADNLLDAKADDSDVPTSYWGQQINNSVISGDITLGDLESVTWGEDSPVITGADMGGLTLQSGVLDSDTAEQHSRIVIDRTGISLDNYENGDWTGEVTLAGVKAGTNETDAVNLSQIQTETWQDIGTGSSYTKAGYYVTVNISESGTFTAGGWDTLFTLPAGYRPSITINSSCTADTGAAYEPGIINVGTDGVVQFNAISATANVSGVITFPIEGEPLE